MSSDAGDPGPEVADKPDYWAALPESAAPPQANGELLFDAPWQGRAFGMAHTLVDAGVFSWDEFREQLIAALDDGAASADVYYERFLLALERTLATVSAPESDDAAAFQAALAERVTEFAARPHGHDH